MEQRVFLLVGSFSLFLVCPSATHGQISTAWMARFNAHDASQDIAAAMDIDRAGNVYVASGYDEPEHPGRDFAVVKYGPTGAQLWMSRYGLTNTIDNARDLKVDGAGNVYVTGTIIESNQFDIVTIKYNPSGVEQWVRRFGGSFNDISFALALDPTGNALVAASLRPMDPSSSDFLLLKYSPAGALLWSRTNSGSVIGIETPGGFAIDSRGDVYLTGILDSRIGQAVTIATVKYEVDGDLVWKSERPGAVNQKAQSIVIDPAGDVLVGSTGPDEDAGDFQVLKYSGSTGALIWMARYDGPTLLADSLVDLALDDAGNAYATGVSHGAGAADIVTIKFSSSGVRQWVARYNGPGNLADEPVRIAVDVANGNVYVGGTSVGSGSQQDFVAIKYDPNGSQQWVFRHDNGGSYDFLTDFAIDLSGNLFLAGSSEFEGTGTDAVTLKLVQNGGLVLPEIVTPPADQSVVLGSGARVVFSVAAAGAGPLSYQWRFNGREIPNATNSTYELVNPQLSEAGEYSVRITNAVGETVSPEARLTIHQPPFLYGQSTNETAIAGASVVLMVFASGDPELQFQWRFNNANLPGETNQVLRLPNVSTNLAGIYTAVVRNPYGEVISSPIRLTVIPRGPLDRWTWRSPLPQGNEISDITYGNGRYVGVGQEGTVVVSTNGLDWADHSQDLGDLLSVVFAEGLFVAGGSAGIYTSPDGISWTFRPMPRRHDGSGLWQNVFALAYGAGRFVAVGTGLLSSDDGITWVDHSQAFGGSFYSGVAYGNGQFVVPYGAVALISTNGTDWVARPSTYNPAQVAFGNGLFIGHSYNAVYVATNGLDWQLVLAPTNTLYFTGVEYANGRYLALGNALYTSPDATNWTQHLASPDQSLTLTATTAGPAGETIVVGDDGAIYRSTDGTSWTRVAGGTPNNLRAIVHAQNRFTIVGNDGVIWHSADGRTFDKTTGPTTNNLRAIAYGNDIYVIVGSRGTLLSSANGLTWQSHNLVTNDLYGLAFVNGHFISAGENGTVLLSTNGRDWAIRYAGVPIRFQGITYGGGLYVASGRQAWLARSYDGHSWTPVHYSSTEIDLGYLESLIYTNGLFIGVGSNGRIFTSGDGTNWTRRLTDSFKELETIIFVEEQFIVGGDRGTVLTSSNAVDWIVHRFLTPNSFRQLIYARGALWGVGNNEMVIQSGQLRPYLTLGPISAAGTEVTVRAEPGQTVKLQRSTNLQNWVDLPAQTMSGDTLQFLDPGADQLRFYRVAP